MELEQAMASQSSSNTAGTRRKRNYPTYQRGPYKGRRKYPYGWNSKKYRTYITSKYPRGSPESINIWGKSWAEADDIQRLRRGVGRYKGEGDFKSFLKGLGKVALRGGGALIGGLKGGPAGAMKGWQGGAGVSKFIGLGDYSTNQIVQGGSSSQQQISVNNDSLTGDIIFAQTEYMGNISVNVSSGEGVTPFVITGYDLNPGLKTFPFLSQIASNFELYDWEGLMVQYKPTSGEFGSSSVSNTLGKVIMATRYGVNQDEGFRNAIEMQNYDYANSSKPSGGMVHGIETDNAQQVSEMMLVRNGQVDAKAPRILYDIGKFYVATEGIPYKVSADTTIVLGELWVTYRVRLSRAKLYTTLGETTVWSKLKLLTTASDIATTLSSSGSLTTELVSGFSNAFQVKFPDDLPFGYFGVTVIVSLAAASNLTPAAITFPANSTVSYNRLTGSPPAPFDWGDNIITTGTNGSLLYTTILKLDNSARKSGKSIFQINFSTALPAGSAIIINIFQTDPDNTFD